MSRTIRLSIEDDPDEIEITIQSASEERANALASKYLLPIVLDFGPPALKKTVPTPGDSRK